MTVLATRATGPARSLAATALAAAALLAALAPAASAAPASAAPASAAPAPTASATAPTTPTATIAPPPAPIAGARSVGAADPDRPLELSVLLAPRGRAALSGFVDAVSTPGSPQYRQFLRSGEFRERFGPTDATIAATRAALRDAGLAPGQPTRSGLLIPVTTTVAGAEAAFHTTIDRYRTGDGRLAIANTTAPRFDAALAPAIDGVIGLDTRSQAQPKGLRSSGVAPRRVASRPPGASPLPLGPGGPQPCQQVVEFAATEQAYTMDQFAAAYDMSPFYAAGNGGAGIDIALFELEPHLATDIQGFQDCYGTNASVTEIDVDGGPGVGAGSGEAALDIQVAIGLAPEADILVYQAPNTNGGSVAAYAAIADDDEAEVVSTSWGSCEPFMSDGEVAAEATIFQQMAAQGQTIVAAAGDDGSEDCYEQDPTATQLAVDDPGSHPTVTSVGGTRLEQPSLPPTEKVWNDKRSLSGAGGGGISELWPMPVYQAGAGVLNPYSSATPCAVALAYCRQVPDVAAAADPERGYVIALDDHWMGIGGTSAAAPLWGAVTALVAASPGCAASQNRVGLLNPALYELAGSTLGALNDITDGDNDYLGHHDHRYPATPGYDMASGLGTPVASRLALGLCGGASAPSITSESNASFAVGQASSFTVMASAVPTAQLSVAGALPAGLTFTDEGDGSATVSGTPSAGSAGTYGLLLSAANGIAPAASQSLTLTVAAAPAPPATTPLVSSPTPAPPPAATSTSPSLPPASSNSRIRLGTVPRHVFAVGPRGGVGIPLSCPSVDGGCTATAALTVTLPSRDGGRGRPVVLARAAGWRLAAGRTRRVWLVVPRRRLAALERASARRLSARLTVTARFANGRSARTATRVVLRLPR